MTTAPPRSKSRLLLFTSEGMETYERDLFTLYPPKFVVLDGKVFERGGKVPARDEWVYMEAASYAILV